MAYIQHVSLITHDHSYYCDEYLIPAGIIASATEQQIRDACPPTLAEQHASTRTAAPV